jgi:hypothetical protein
MLELTNTSRKELHQVSYEHALYFQIQNGDILIVYLYVDDLIFTGSNRSMFEEFKKEMTKEFEMTNIRFMSYYLDIEVKEENGILITPSVPSKTLQSRNKKRL